MKLDELLKFVTTIEELYIYDWEKDITLFHGTKKEIKLEDYSDYEIVSIHPDYGVEVPTMIFREVFLDIYLKKTI